MVIPGRAPRSMRISIEGVYNDGAERADMLCTVTWDGDGIHTRYLGHRYWRRPVGAIYWRRFDDGYTGQVQLTKALRFQMQFGVMSEIWNTFFMPPGKWTPRVGWSDDLLAIVGGAGEGEDQSARDHRLEALDARFNPKLDELRKLDADIAMLTPQQEGLHWTAQRTGLNPKELANRMGIRVSRIYDVRNTEGQGFAPSSITELELLCADYGLTKLANYWHDQGVVARQRVALKGGKW